MSSDLQEIVELMGRSVMGLDMVQLEDIGLTDTPADSPLGPMVPVDPVCYVAFAIRREPKLFSPKFCL